MPLLVEPRRHGEERQLGRTRRRNLVNERSKRQGRGNLVLPQALEVGIPPPARKYLSMEASTIEFRRRGRVRQWLSGDAPPSRATQLFLFISALLCGAALSGLLFAGIWRHTAGEVARTRDAQVGDHRALVAARRELTALKGKLGREQELQAAARRAATSSSAALAETRRALAKARRTLAGTRAADAAARRALSAQLQALVAAAGTVEKQATTLRSELNALESYAGAPGAAGIDAGYVASQARYLIASAANAVSAAGDVVARAQALSAG